MLNIDSNILGYWGFDETTPNTLAVDLSNNSRNLSLTGSTDSIFPGRVNNSRYLDGDGTYFSSSNSSIFRIVNDLTIFLWFRIDEIPENLETIVSCSSNSTILYSIDIDEDLKIHYRHTNFECVTNNSLSLNIFHSIVIRRKDDKLSIFLDNEKEDFNLTNLSSISSEDFLVGKSYYNSENNYLKGYIDELSIHNIARSDNYIKSVYNSIVFKGLNKIVNDKRIKSIDGIGLYNNCRWWVYERFGNIYVVREKPLGVFEDEVLLLKYNSKSACSELPDLFFDKDSGKLICIFNKSGQVFSIEADYSDTPETTDLNVDTNSRLYNTRIDAIRTGVGHNNTSDNNNLDLQTFDSIKLALLDNYFLNNFGTGYNNDNSFMNLENLGDFIFPDILFVDYPSFGLEIADINENREYYIYNITGINPIFLGVANPPTDQYRFYHIPLNKVFGNKYIVLLIKDNKVYSSRIITDLLDRLTINFYTNQNIYGNYYNPRTDGFYSGIGVSTSNNFWE